MFFNKTPKKSILDIAYIKNKHRIIDIRKKNELTRFGKIKGSQHIPKDKLLENPSNYLNPEFEYYIYCQTGIRSKRVVKKLNKEGFNLVNLSGGYVSYDRLAK